MKLPLDLNHTPADMQEAVEMLKRARESQIGEIDFEGHVVSRAIDCLSGDDLTPVEMHDVCALLISYAFRRD